MSGSRQLLKGTALLTIGQVLSYGLSFARNVILARMLTKADFGLAAIFAMTITMLELAGRMSFGHQIVQSKQGNLETFQATSHTFQLVLSFAGALLILTLSAPLARAMNVPELAWAFATLAIVPLSRGFEHLDYYQQQRSLNYLPVTVYEVVPQLVMTAAAWPLAIWLGDFRVVILLMIGKAMMAMAMTHLVAVQPYRWGWHKDHVRGMWTFGWPLLINGLLIFASQQADQVLVGSYFSLETLAPYALALLLVSIPGNIFARIATALMLPLLSRAQDDPSRFRKRNQTCLEYASVAAVIFIVPLIVAGEQIATLLYGAKYSGTGSLMAILGATAAVRFLRIVPAIASMARADTVNQLYSNLCRGLSLPLAFIAIELGGSVVLVASCALAAEIAAAAVSMIRLSFRQSIPLRDMLGSSIYLSGFVLGGLLSIQFGATFLRPWHAAGFVIIILLLATLLAKAIFSESASELVHVIRKQMIIKC